MMILIDQHPSLDIALLHCPLMHCPACTHIAVIVIALHTTAPAPLHNCSSFFIARNSMIAISLWLSRNCAVHWAPWPATIAGDREDYKSRCHIADCRSRFRLLSSIHIIRDMATHPQRLHRHAPIASLHLDLLHYQPCIHKGHYAADYSLGIAHCR